MENENVIGPNYMRNRILGGMIVNNSEYFKNMLRPITSPNGSSKNPIQGIEVNYDNIALLSEFAQGATAGVCDRIYYIPLTLRFENGNVQIMDVLIDDSMQALATIPHINTNRKDTSIFYITQSLFQNSADLASELKKSGYSESDIKEVFKLANCKSFDEFIAVLNAQNRTAPSDKLSAIQALNEISRHNFQEEGHTTEQLNSSLSNQIQKEQEEASLKKEKNPPKNVSDLIGEEEKKLEDPTKPKIKSDIPPTEEVEKEGTPKLTEEEENALPTNIEKSKLAKIIEKSGVPISQIQDIVIVPHPMELNTYLPGNKLNNNEEVVLIKFRGGSTPPRFQIMQGEGENLTKVEVHGTYNRELQEIFPEKSTIGARADKIQKKEADTINVSLTCDGKAQHIDLTNVPISQKMDLVKTQLMMNDLEEIQRKGEMEIKAAQSIVDPVKREEALAEAHKSIADDIEVLQAPGYDDDNAIKTHMAEITEHLAAAKEAEAEKIKAEEEEAAAAAAEAKEEAAKEVPEEEQVSEAAKAMLGIGLGAVAGAAAVNTLKDTEINDLLESITNSQDEKSDTGGRTIGPSYDYADGRMRIYPTKDDDNQ
ncbi:MAG: hypothetical protein IKN09_00980 [Clostridia bacterium]|nr:hypothetical protein [Clostridia bacterium]